MTIIFMQYIKISITKIIIFIVILNTVLTDGLFGNPTRCPQAVSKLTRHSLTLPCNKNKQLKKSL